MEATPSLKPSEQKWYTACFSALLFIMAVELFETIFTYPKIYGSLDRIGFVAELLGGMLGVFIVLVPGLIFVLALLFFFDGWISRAIVGIVLVGAISVFFLSFLAKMAEHQRVLANPPLVQPVDSIAGANTNSDKGIAGRASHRRSTRK